MDVIGLLIVGVLVLEIQVIGVLVLEDGVTILNLLLKIVWLIHQLVHQHVIIILDVHGKQIVIALKCVK